MNRYNITHLPSILFDSCILISLGCSLFSILVQGNWKKIAFKLIFLGVCFSNEILWWPWLCFSKSPPISLLHTEMQLFFTPWSTEKIWTELCAEQTPFGPLVLLGILHLKELLVNRSASRGELTDWSGSDMWRTTNHEEKTWGDAVALCKSCTESCDQWEIRERQS